MAGARHRPDAVTAAAPAQWAAAVLSDLSVAGQSLRTRP